MNLDLDSPIAFRFSSFRAFDKGESHVTRTCEDSVLLLVYEGVLRFEENGEQIEVFAGEYYIQQAFLPQVGNRPSDSPKYYYAHFSGSFTDAPSLKTRGKWDESTILPLCEQLEEISLSQGDLLQKSICFYRILSQLYGYNATPVSPLAKAVRDRINREYAMPLTVTELARDAGLSVNHLITLFAKAYGVTPHKYLSKLRLSEAEKLLRATQESEEQIAFSVGFSDFSVFYKAFLKAYGFAPRLIRKRAHSALSAPVETKETDKP